MAVTEPVGNWGRWGEDDERGALNLINDAMVLGASHACRSGRVYPLGLPIQRDGIPSVDDRGPSQRLTLLNQTDEARNAADGGEPGDGQNEDVLVIPSHASTHMDALCHIYHRGSVYNSFPQDDVSSYDGAPRCGIEKARTLVGRGVLIDVAAHEEKPWLEPGRAITAADLRAALERQGTELRAGDIVLVRTGWVESFRRSGEMSFDQPGIGVEAARMLAAADIAAVGSDNTAVEVMPTEGGAFLPVHVELLVRRGIYLIEHLDLAELSRDRCHEFLLIVAPLLVTGASASPVNPIAIA